MNLGLKTNSILIISKTNTCFKFTDLININIHLHLIIIKKNIINNLDN